MDQGGFVWHASDVACDSGSRGRRGGGGGRLAGLGFAAELRAKRRRRLRPARPLQTQSGPACGVTTAGQTPYLDIPYAAPPVGGLRWMPPQPVQPWTSTYQTTQRGPECVQPGFPAGSPPLAGTSEDCLYLEVQEPAGAHPGQNLPVLFEIHGGGFLGEYRDDDGTNFVSAGPAIYVYVGYRLGILGFLADKALGPIRVTTGCRISKPPCVG